MITSQPRPVSTLAGGRAVFSVMATGNAPLSFQWRKDGSLVGNANLDVLMLTNAQFSDAGRYSVLVSNAAGKVVSSNASLTVTPPKGGDVDWSFNPGSSIHGTVYSMAAQSNGKVVIGGGFDNVGGAVRGRVARLNSDGTIDHTFMNGLAGADGDVYAVVVQTDGKVLIGGYFRNVNGQARKFLARLHADGNLDTTFLNSVMGTTNSAYPSVLALAIQADGKVLIGGYFQNVNGQPRNMVARLNRDGSLDTTFLNGLTGSDAACKALAVQPDGKALIGGDFENVNGQRRGHFARLNADGGLDATFSGASGGADSSVLSIGLQPDGKVLIGGYFSSVAGQPRECIARLKADGSLDTTFPNGLLGGNQLVCSVALQPDGKVLIAGEFDSVSRQPRGRIARLNADGSLDATFMNGLAGADQIVRSVVVPASGKVVVGGDFVSVNGRPHNGLARLNADGNLDTTFLNGFTGDGGPDAMAIQPDGKVLIGGYFTSVRGQPRNRIARLNADGSLDNTFLNGLAGADKHVACVAVQSDGKVLIGGIFTSVNGQPRNGIARLHASGSLDTGFLNGLAGAPGGVGELAVQPDGMVLIGGSFTSVNGQPRKHIARLNPNGSLDTTFLNGLAGPNGGVRVALQGDGKVLIGGYFTSVNGQPRNNIARLNADGSLDAGFLSSLAEADYVRSLAVQPDGKVVIGGGNGYSRVFVERLNPNGTRDAALLNGSLVTTNGNYPTLDVLALQADGKVLIGGMFHRVKGQPRNRMARLNADGSLDTTFLNGLAGASDYVRSMVVQSDGKVLIGGAFTSINGAPMDYLARLWDRADTQAPTLTITVPAAGQRLSNSVFTASGRAADDGLLTGVRCQLNDDLWQAAAGSTNWLASLTLTPGTNILRAYAVDSHGNRSPTNTVRFSYVFLSRFMVLTNGMGKVTPDYNNAQLEVGRNYSLTAAPAPGWAFINWTGSLTTNTAALTFRMGSLTTLTANFRDVQAPTVTITAPIASQRFSNNVYLATGQASDNGEVQFVQCQLNGGAWQKALGTTNWSVALTFTQGTNTLRVYAQDGYGNRSKTNTVACTYVPTVPVITLQPTSVTAGVNGIANFRVAAYGTAPLSYQWRKDGNNLRDSAKVLGAATPSLMLANLQPADAGGISVVVNNPVGSTTSRVATLTVSLAPLITSQPQPASMVVGGRAIFSVMADGLTPLAYQWRKDGVPLVRATNDVLIVSNTLSSDAGRYSVLVSNLAGTVVSSNAPLTVTSPKGGDVDWSFDPGSTMSGSVAAVALQADGKVVIGGYFTSVGGVIRGRVARLNQDGTTDHTFLNGLAGADGNVYAVALQADGKVVIGGYFTSVNGQARNGVARLHTDGRLDTTFVNGLAGAGVLVQSVVLQGEGTVLLGGFLANVNGKSYRSVVRLHPDGSLDTSAFGGLAWVNSAANALAVQTDGKVLIGGAFTSVNGQPRNHIARLHADGSLDASFLNGLAGANTEVTTMALRAGGKMLIAGRFTQVNGQPRGRIARLNPDGSLDNTFLNGLAGADGPIQALAVQADGKVLIGGGFASVNGQPRGRIARLNPDGSLDAAFLNGLTGADTGVSALAIQADGRLLIGGPFTSVNGQARNRIGRLESNGDLDPTFLNGLAGANDSIGPLVTQADGKVLIGGSFTSVNGQPRGRIARLNADGSLDRTYLNGLAGANEYVMSVAVQADGKGLIGGYFTSVNGQPRNRIARLNVDGSLDATFLTGMAGADDHIRSVAVQSDKKVLVGGDFASVNGQARGRVARLNADGSLDTTFLNGLAGANADVSSVALQPDGKVLIGGAFTSVNGQPRNHIARLHADGSLDTSFLNGVTGSDSYVGALLVQPDGKVLIGGSFTSVNGQSRNRIARLNANGSLDTSFLNGLTGPDQSVGALLVQLDGKVVIGGYFTSVNGQSRNRIARLHANGSLDTTFLNGLTGADQVVSGLALQDDGRVLIGGRFRGVNGAPMNCVVRLWDRADTQAPTLAITAPTSGQRVSNSVFAASGRATDDGRLAGVQYRLNDGVWQTADGGTNWAASLTLTPGTNTLQACSVDTHGNRSATNTVRFSYVALSKLTVLANGAGKITPDYNGSQLEVGRNYTITATAATGFAFVNWTGSLTTNTAALTFRMVPLMSLTANFRDLQAPTVAITTPTAGQRISNNVFQATGKAKDNGQVQFVQYQLNTGAWEWAVGTTNWSAALTFTSRTNVLRAYAQDGYGNRSQTNTVTFIYVPTVPVITLQPASLTAGVNGSAHFRVAAYGSAPMSYQWRKDGNNLRDGAKVLGAATPSLMLANLQPADAGGISVVVNNPVGSTTSRVATLTVSLAPLITSQPQPASMVAGGRAIFSVMADGLTPLTYQWRKDGTPLVHATNDVLIVTNAQMSRAGRYTVVVSNLAGTVVSSNAMLTVTSPKGGDVDWSFDPGSAVDSDVRAVAQQPDGKVVLGGGFTSVGGAARGRVARLNRDGTADHTFMNGLAGADATVEAVALQADGKVLIGGYFTSVNGQPRNRIARLNADGSLDTTFLNGLMGTDSDVRALALQADGKVLIGGYFTSVNGQLRNGIARLNADGSLDTSFLDDQDWTERHVEAVVVQSDGKLLIGGSFTRVSGQPRNRIARLNADGSLDTTFLNALSGPSDSVWSLAVQFDGKVLIGGFFTSVNGQPRNRIARLNSDGSLDATFLNGLAGVNQVVMAVASQGDGKVLIGGNFTSVNGQPRNRIARLNADGSLDTSFLNGLTGPDQSVGALLVQLDGKVLIGGYFTSVNGQSRNKIARLHANGSLDTSFPQALTGIDGGLSALVLQPDGKALVGGYFTSVNGRSRNNLARLNANGGLDASFLNGLAGPDQYVGALVVQPDGKVLIGGAFTSVNGQPRNRIARLNADGSLDATFLNGLTGANQVVIAVALQGDGKVLIGGNFTSVNGQPRNRIARLNADGSLDATFLNGLTGANQVVIAVALQGDGKVLIGGDLTSVNGQPRGRIARLNVDGSLDAGFLNGLTAADLLVRALALQPDGKVLFGGSFTSVNGQPRNRIARLNANGSLDTTFLNGLTGANQEVSAVAVQGDGKVLIAGYFTNVNGQARREIARLNPNGSLDTTFMNGLSGVDGEGYSLAIQPDGKVLIAGWFGAINGAPMTHLARLWDHATTQAPAFSVRAPALSQSLGDNAFTGTGLQDPLDPNGWPAKEITNWPATFALDSAATPQLILVSPHVAAAQFEFAVQGLLNQAVVVERSWNLVDWQPIHTNTINGGVLHFQDLLHPVGSGFYRVRTP